MKFYTALRDYMLANHLGPNITIGDLGSPWRLIHSARQIISPDVGLRVKYTNSLHKVVSRRCPVNKVGQPMVSTFDEINASIEEQCESLCLTLNIPIQDE